MVEVFKYVDKFFTSLTNYLTYNHIFLIFVGLFLVTALFVLFFTARSYEAKLIKAIDKFNIYFIDNPNINEENLVAFNAKMKSKKVPKQLRKHWQQFVLYRESKASSYMSFENCVSNPIRNSTYKRDVKTMNIMAWILSFCALILNCYHCFETADLASILQKVLLCPIIILVLNYILQIFLNLRHSAIVSDLYQNYQYFEVNIDKATQTLPEYVDYEVLFDRNEIKKGIPILYAYLQKRAEEEKRELERARLRNVEHEKFNFDDQGVAASLVLERAMQEAENYIAERKKYTQDIGQINSDITQEDMNYREITKEYNRQMQVSKETFENFKAQLQDVSSSIEANYLKKQQQQELDRQRNLERDFDTATERHKKVIESYHAELDTVDKFIAQSRKNLEDAMKSEFSSYSSKVYDEAKKLVDERQRDKIAKFKQNIVDLEETIVSKNNELEQVYQQNQIMSDKLEEIGIAVNDQPGYSSAFRQQEPVAPEVKNTPEDNDPEDEEPSGFDIKPEFEDETINLESIVNEAIKEDDESIEDESEPNLNVYPSQEVAEDEDIENFDLDEETSIDEENNTDEETAIDEEFVYDEDNEDLIDENISTETIDDSIIQKPASRRGRPRKVVDAVQTQGEKKKPGRPRKVQPETVEPNEKKRGRGRPRKEVTTEKPVAPVKKGRGRPKKQEVSETVDSSRGRGRPKKEATIEKPVAPVKKGRGRPKKQEVSEVADSKRGRGRPRKEETTEKPVAPVKKGRGRPKKQEVSETVNTKRGRGRPRKDQLNDNIQVDDISNINEIDEYLKEIDNAIAAESAKIEETQKELAKKAKLKSKK